MNDTVFFSNTEQALYWLMEQKRKKYSISTSNIETLDEEPTTRELTVSELLKWSGAYKYPKGKEEVAMALKVLENSFMKLDKRSRVILVLLYLGDFATPELYNKAKKMQKVLKQRGYRVVLNYKYTKVKVAEMLKLDRKTITRRVQAAKEVIKKDLLKANFIMPDEK